MRYNKYNAIKTVIDGIKFDSGAEARRYSELKLLEKAGVITDLELQPRYDIVINGQKICFYKADFRYNDSNGFQITEDVKGMKTPVYNLKKKLVKACHDVEIVEIRS